MAWHFVPGVQKMVESYVRVCGGRYMLFHSHMLKPFPSFLHHLSYATQQIKSAKQLLIVLLPFLTRIISHYQSVLNQA